MKFAHIADTHIKNLKYHTEYKTVFNKIYEYCTKDPYCFMYVDMKDHQRPVRKNFDEVILMDQFKKEENGSSR